MDDPAIPHADPPPITTARLHLRPLRLDDDGFVLELLNSQGWLRFIGDKHVRDREGARQYLRNGPLAMYARRGFGMLMIERRTDGTPLGMAGLIRRDGLDDVDLGYALLPQHAGAGLAFEAANAVLDDGRTRLGLRRVCAITDLANDRSIGLLQRLGFSFEKLLPPNADGVPLRLFGRPLDAPPAA